MDDLRLHLQCPQCSHYIDNIEIPEVFACLEETHEKCEMGENPLVREKCKRFVQDIS